MAHRPSDRSRFVTAAGPATLVAVAVLCSSVGGCSSPAEVGACATTCAAPLVCERAAPAGCEDPSWASWPMPNAPADVAAGAPNPMGYAFDAAGGIATDQVTSLMWQRAVSSGQQYTWRDALSYCASLTLGGHDDWRLPTEIELVSLVDDSIATPPAIDAAAFPDTPAGYYWSSIPAAGSLDNAWLVDFDTGSAYAAAVDAPEYVRCVR